MKRNKIFLCMLFLISQALWCAGMERGDTEALHSCELLQKLNSHHAQMASQFESVLDGCAGGAGELFVVIKQQIALVSRLKDFYLKDVSDQTRNCAICHADLLMQIQIAQDLKGALEELCVMVAGELLLVLSQTPVTRQSSS